MTDKELIALASEARKRSYSPYSGYSVGAALLAENGKIYTGCNIENASYTPTVCAERTAVFKAVSEGERCFVKIAIVGGKKGTPDGWAPPCGVCRQVLNEFCDPHTFQILLTDGQTESSYTLAELLPHSFGSESL
ncbi:MAG: cytidine deaminase [Clostridia bacterium]|nr:cytidine deaminase [Clostridia bacterium]